VFAAASLFDWVMGKLPVLIFLLVFVSQVVRGWMRSREEKPAPQAKPDSLEEQRRTREVQEQIRRRIAARRGEVAAPPLAPSEPLPPAMPRRMETTQMPEPIGGPLRRVLEELQREILPPPAPPPSPVRVPVPTALRSESLSLELERQQQLAENLRVLEESRVLVERRAKNLAADNYAASQSEGGLRSVVRDRVLADVRDPASLRRAFVLREVLGAPVALR
jgi:hypothetical protein